MNIPTSESLIAASNDADLKARIVALGRYLGLSEGEILEAMPNIVGAPCTEDGSTIAGVYEYAVATYVPQPPPGKNPAAVTDVHILTALEIFNPASSDPIA